MLGRVFVSKLSNWRIILSPLNVGLTRFGGSPVKGGLGAGVGLGDGVDSGAVPFIVTSNELGKPRLTKSILSYSFKLPALSLMSK